MSLIDFAALLVVGAVLSAIGKGVTRMVFGSGPKAGRKGWRGVFYVTMWLHPIAAGALLGIGPWLPAPEFMGDAMLGRVMWYALAGVFSTTAYDGVSLLLKHRTGLQEEARKSQAPK